MRSRRSDPRTKRVRKPRTIRILEMLGITSNRSNSEKNKNTDLIASSIAENVKAHSRPGSQTSGRMVRIKRSDVIKALNEVNEATSVDEVLSSGSRAKRILKLYRETHKVCG